LKREISLLQLTYGHIERIRERDLGRKEGLYEDIDLKDDVSMLSSPTNSRNKKHFSEIAVHQNNVREVFIHNGHMDIDISGSSSYNNTCDDSVSTNASTKRMSNNYDDISNNKENIMPSSLLKCSQLKKKGVVKPYTCISSNLNPKLVRFSWSIDYFVFV